MEVIKKYEKFKTYKTVFAVFLVTVVLSSATGSVIYLTQPAAIPLGEFLRNMASDVRLSPILELCLLLWVFTAGPTIYAPTVSFLSTVMYGILWGVRVSAYCDTAFSFAVEILFSGLAAYFLVIYSSFVTLTSMRIFTPTKTNDKNELFDGVMFRAEKFRGIFNFRYILSYIMFFLAFAVAVCFFSVSRAFLLSL